VTAHVVLSRARESLQRAEEEPPHDLSIELLWSHDTIAYRTNSSRSAIQGSLYEINFFIIITP